MRARRVRAPRSPILARACHGSYSSTDRRGRGADLPSAPRTSRTSRWFRGSWWRFDAVDADLASSARRGREPQTAVPRVAHDGTPCSGRADPSRSLGDQHSVGCFRSRVSGSGLSVRAGVWPSASTRSRRVRIRSGSVAIRDSRDGARGNPLDRRRCAFDHRWRRQPCTGRSPSLAPSDIASSPSAAFQPCVATGPVRRARQHLFERRPSPCRRCQVRSMRDARPRQQQDTAVAPAASAATNASRRVSCGRLRAAAPRCCAMARPRDRVGRVE